MTHKIIAIDGPAASGKGTLARNLANHLGFAYLDTGALYRCVGMEVLKKGGDPGDETQAVSAAQSLQKILKPEDLQNPELRTDAAGQAASKVAQFPAVRQALFDFQKTFAETPIPSLNGVILDGRDIGTVICPNAHIKFFITASVEERARRRQKELEAKDLPADFDTVLADMKQRDARDTERDFRPLKPADDAHIIDTSAMDAEEALNKALCFIEEKSFFK